MKKISFILIIISNIFFLQIGKCQTPCPPRITVVNNTIAGCSGNNGQLHIEGRLLSREECSESGGIGRAAIVFHCYELNSNNSAIGIDLCDMFGVSGLLEPGQTFDFNCDALQEGHRYLLTATISGDQQPFYSKNIGGDCNLTINAHSTPATCEDDFGTIQGSVTGNSCDGITVKLSYTEANGGTEYVVAVTDKLPSGGSFTFPNLAPRTYTVRAFVNPFCIRTNSVTVESPRLKTFYLDSDRDGWGTKYAQPCHSRRIRNNFSSLDIKTETTRIPTTIEGCTEPSGYSSRVGDCNDCNPKINPEAKESCDDEDNNCILGNNEGMSTSWYPDIDEDGKGNAHSPPRIVSCNEDAPEYYVSNNTDCDDHCKNCLSDRSPCSPVRPIPDDKPVPSNGATKNLYDKDKIILNNNTGNDKAIIVLDAEFESSGCKNDVKFETTDEIEIENVLLNTSCNDEIIVFSKDNAMYVSSNSPWTDEPGDNLRIQLKPPIIVPLKFWFIKYNIQDTEPTQMLPAINSIFIDNLTGIQFTAISVRILLEHFEESIPHVVGEPDFDFKLRESNYYDPNRLNIYFLPYKNIFKKDGKNFHDLGLTMSKNTIFIFHDAIPSAICHEIGHAFDVEHFDEPIESNVLQPSTTDFEQPNRFSLFTLGQIFRMNTNEESWINRHQLRAHEVTRI